MNRAATSLAKVGLVLVLLWTAVGRASAADNVVVQWNEATVDAIRNTKTPPPIASRAFAMTHTAMFDAWTAYDSVALSTRLGGVLRRPEGERASANKEKAISFAAYRALVDLFPTQMPLFDALMVSLGYDPSDLSLDTSSPSGIGNVSAQALLSYRHFDGSNQLGDLHPGAYSDYTGYTPVNTVDTLNDPNKWQPLLVGGVPQAWLLPQWGLVEPFALSSGSEFRNFILAYGPALYPHGSYRKQAIAVLHLSARLNDTAKVIVEYWADGPGTATPPGHWNLIARAISQRDAHSLDDDVKLFFILGNALMDAGIAVWDCKRATDSIRPVSAIRFLFGGKPIRAWAGPGMGTQLIEGRQFQSYIPTPPFASYISGHSTFSAAAAEVLKRFSGSDHFGASFTALPGSSVIEPGLTPATAVTLTWATFTDAADQAGLSRRYGGIHFLADDLVGRETGRLVAAVVWKKAMSYINGTAQQP
jgi:membrane-associated phospholipid phosphatase